MGDRQGRPDREPRWGKVGKQKIEDTGPLTKKRMETCDDEFVAAAKDFIKRQNKAGKPFFVWLNTTHMHLFTHTKKKSLGQAGRWQSPYHDTMIDHDKNVGQMLDLLDELGIADNTFVMYSTDNGPHRNSWPDGGMTPFRSEKNTNWEGAFRIPLLVRWPGKIKAGSVSNGIVQHHDWLPTFLAMAGDPDVVDKLKKGYKAIGRTYKNHIDGYNLLPYLTGKEKESPRKLFFYISDDGDILGAALRQLEDRVHGAALPRHACRSGRSRSPGCGCRSSSTCAPTRTNSPTSRRTWLLRMVPPSRLHLFGATSWRPSSRRLQGFPADPEAEQLHDRRRDQDAVRIRQRRALNRILPQGAAADLNLTALHRADERGGDIQAAALYHVPDLSARTPPKHRIPERAYRRRSIVLAGAVAGGRQRTTAMKAISDKSKSSMPAFGYPVPYHAQHGGVPGIRISRDGALLTAVPRPYAQCLEGELPGSRRAASPARATGTYGSSVAAVSTSTFLRSTTNGLICCTFETI